MLVEKTVSQYLFERALTLNGQESQIKRVKLVNTSDSDIATAFISDTSQDAVVDLEADGLHADREDERREDDLQLLEDSR